jgi:hypothetical protein
MRRDKRARLGQPRADPEGSMHEVMAYRFVSTAVPDWSILVWILAVLEQIWDGLGSQFGSG